MTDLPRSHSSVGNREFPEWNRLFGNISNGIDELVNIYKQFNDNSLLFELSDLINRKLKVIEELKKACPSSISISNYNSYLFHPSVAAYAANSDHNDQQVQVGKKFQLRADAPAFQPSLLKIENAKLQAVSERTSRNVQPEFILFPSDKLKSIEANKQPETKMKPISAPSNLSNLVSNAANKVIAKPPEKKRTNSLEIKEMKKHRDEWDDESVRKQVKEATEKVWAEAEAWVDAEAEAEENEWRILEMGINRYVGLSDINDLSLSDVPLGHSLFSFDKKTSISLNNLDKIGSLTLGSLECISLFDVSPFSTPNKANEEDGFSPINTKSTGRFYSPVTTSGRSLHEKLSSPDRKKRAISPTEARRRYEDRLLIAETNRDKNVAEKVQKAMIVVNRVKEKMVKQAERQVQAGEALEGKLKGAEQRHSKYLSDVKEKAGSENAKVSEVISLHSVNTEVLAQQLQQRLEDAENRILAANLRREQRLAGISCSQKKKNSRKTQQMSEFKLQLEKLKMERWEKLQKRFEAVQERQRKRLEEMKRRAVVASGVNLVTESPPDESEATHLPDAANNSISKSVSSPSIQLNQSLQSPSSNVAISTPLLSATKVKILKKKHNSNCQSTFSPITPNASHPLLLNENCIPPNFSSSPCLSPSSSSAQLMIHSGRSSVSSLPLLPTNLSTSLQDTYKTFLDLFYKRSQKLLTLRTSLWESLLQCFHYSVVEGHEEIIDTENVNGKLHTASSVLGQHIYANDVWKLAQEVLLSLKEKPNEEKEQGKFKIAMLLPLKEIVKRLQQPKKTGNVERVASSYSLYFSIIIDIRNVGLLHESTALSFSTVISIPSLQNDSSHNVDDSTANEQKAPDDNMLATLNYIDLIEQINFLLQNTLDIAMGKGTCSGNQLASCTTRNQTPLTPAFAHSSSSQQLSIANNSVMGSTDNVSNIGEGKLNDFITSGGVFLLCILLSYEFGILSHSQIMTNIIEDIFYRHFSHSQQLESSTDCTISKANAITSWQVIDFPHLLDLLSLIVMDYIHPISYISSTSDSSKFLSISAPISSIPANHLSEVLGCGLPIVIMELLYYFLQLQHTMHIHVSHESTAVAVNEMIEDDLLTSSLGPNEEECMPVIRHYTSQLLAILNVILRKIIQSVNNFNDTVSLTTPLHTIDESINHNLLTVLYNCQQYMLLNTMFSQILDQCKLELLALQAYISRVFPRSTVFTSVPDLTANPLHSSTYLIGSLEFFQHVVEYVYNIELFVQFVRNHTTSHHNTLPLKQHQQQQQASQTISSSNWNTLSKQYWSIIRRNLTLTTILEMIYTLALILHSCMFTTQSLPENPLFLPLMRTLIVCIDSLSLFVSIDGELWKSLPLDSKKTYLNVFHRLILLFFTRMEQNNPIDDLITLSPNATLLHNEDEQGGSSMMMTLHQVFEQMIINLLNIVTMISYHDHEIRQYLSTSLTMDSACIPTHLVSIITKSNNTGISSTDNLQQPLQSIPVTSSFLSSIATLPIRYFKDSRLKHTLIPCLIMGSLELDHHTQLIKYCRKDKFVRKFIEYQIKESEQLILLEKEIGKEEEFIKRTARMNKIYELLPKSTWDVITLVWLDMTTSNKN